MHANTCIFVSKTPLTHKHPFLLGLWSIHIASECIPCSTVGTPMISAIVLYPYLNLLDFLECIECIYMYVLDFQDTKQTNLVIAFF